MRFETNFSYGIPFYSVLDKAAKEVHTVITHVGRVFEMVGMSGR